MEIIDLENEEQNSKDRLFYSPISTKKKILIICIGNTCRSAIFHNYLVSKNISNIEIYSAGTDIKSDIISDDTIKVLSDNNIEIIKNTTNKLSEYINIEFDDIIILDENIDISNIPNSRRIVKFYLKDPHGLEYKEYQNTFDEIKEYIDKNIFFYF